MKYTGEFNGIINIYKEKGFTSFDVVALVRKYSRTKTGHTGTLDPDAEGVLPVCLGKSTRLCDYIMGGDKEYIAGVTLGVTTDTRDASGRVTETRAVSCSPEEIIAALNSFLPGYDQLPPMYSAIKVGGKKLYELARSGKEIEIKPRRVDISEIEFLERQGTESFKIRVACSKGTYIRSLAHDIGQRLGCGAHMNSLLRTRSGEFSIETCVRLSEVKAAAESGSLSGLIIPPERVLSGLARVYVSQEAEKYLLNGNAITEEFIINGEIPGESGAVLVFSGDGRLFGIYKTDAGGARVLRSAVRLI